MYKKRNHDERDDTEKTIENEKKPGNVEQSGNLKACKKRKHDEIDVQMWKKMRECGTEWKPESMQEEEET